MSRQERIFLVGPMGCGKSSIGKSLALVLERPFLDLDEVIVREAGMSIPEIFEKEGERGFRVRETAALRSSLKHQAITATGGGIVTTPENLGILKDHGIVCYLTADAETSYRRTLKDNGRPMIATDDRKGRLEQLLKVRDPLYRSICDFTVDSAAHSVRECVELIKKALEKCRG